jgi:hypothetical protein
MFRIVIGAVLALLWCGQCAATSVVAIWTPTRIVIGSDSKATGPHGEDRGAVCKILVADKNVIAGIAGIYEVPAADFHLKGFVLAALATVGDLTAKMDSLQNSIMTPLTNFLRGISVGDPVYYQQHYSGKAAIEVIFASYQNEIVRFVVRDFIAVDGLPGKFLFVKPMTRTCPTGQNCGSPTYVTMGENTVVDALIHRDYDIADRLGFEEAARYLVQSEIDAMPADIGPPIAIAEVTGLGISWVSKGKCTDQ